LTDSNYTHLLVIVDRSGSMFSVASDMRGALDSLFAEQAKVEGKCLVDYVQFDNTYEVVFTDKEVADAKAQLDPRGSTALLDAIGKASTDLGKKLKEKPESERPGLVQVVIVTDGYENASTEWDAAGVKQLIKQQEETYNWDYIFLGANLDAVAVGGTFGVKGGKSLTYNVNDTYSMSLAAGEYVTRSRVAAASGQSVSSNAFTQEERDAQSV
jgi:hypothetical protein